MFVLSSLTAWPPLFWGVLITQLLALYFVYLFVANITLPSGRAIPGSRFLIVIAHPDDETMFFGPFLASEAEQNSELHVLCFSRGDFYVNGDVRRRELNRAVDRLGVSTKLVTVLGWPQFPDNPNIRWRMSDVRDVILDYCNGHPQIEAIVTFDAYGVSGHLNHLAIADAVKNLAKEPEFDQRIFTLESVSILRKYCRPLDEVFCAKWPPSYRYRVSETMAERVQWALLAHESQMLWFRHLYRWFSRYMRVNTFEELDKRRSHRKKLL
ncbi:N-acetylglucosaminyl-phosphatidylinositol de-N-acetylase-like [Tropilaelaps mercedesae]|uniref:N-acetylglucosaminylphosphatidylinositol deacetylase n=1 Tax=Tropilaelaps mercedesae TaxID=418985 RepID=A0A1V9XPN9_9ACAR|nr:N-acetylglucosaminyl-phosphatidylinositol de-N-acetylase-like [Tropilaelaps mercedesae]